MAVKKQRLFVIDTNPRSPKFIGEFDDLKKAKAQAKKKSEIIVQCQDDLNDVKKETKIKLIALWRGDDDVANVSPVALEYRVMNLLIHWVGNLKIKLGDKTMSTTTKKAVTKKAPATKKKVVKKAPVKKAPVKKPVKKAPVKKPTGKKVTAKKTTVARKGVDEKAFRAAVARCRKDKMTISECYKALRSEFSISAISPVMKRFDLTYP